MMLRGWTFSWVVMLGLAGAPAVVLGQEASPAAGQREEPRPDLVRRPAGSEAAGSVRGTFPLGPRSYAEAHEQFHLELDLNYRALAAERPFDLRRQLELRARRSAEHDRWHAAMGRRHE
jgi:hypothetical protein